MLFQWSSQNVKRNAVERTCTMAYTPNGTALAAQVNIMDPGRPSVFFCFQLYQICGNSWMHQKTVPMVPRTLAEMGMEVCGAISFACTEGGTIKE